MARNKRYGFGHSPRRCPAPGVFALAVSGLVVGGTWAAGTVTPQPKMGEPLEGLTAEELALWEVGRVQFDRVMLIEDGLGPIFNKESCGNCHNVPVLGGSGSQTVTRFGRSEKGGFDPLEEFGGSLLQAQAIDPDCAEVVHPDANVESFRVTNGSMGYGLIEAIPDADILALEQPPPGISGRAHMVEAFEAAGISRAGRFGWKAQVPTILTFSADAARNEMGITNIFVPTENDPNGILPPDLADCDTVPDPEDHLDSEDFYFFDRVTHFLRFLAPPPQTPRSGMTGEGVFETTGCSQCHTPQFITADDRDLEAALRNKVIRPYSDFLLHDIGEHADFIVQGDAGERELKTPPLWGLNKRDPVWHDGRFGGGTFAERVTLAIEAHGGFGSEALDSGVFAAWQALTQPDKDHLVAFLASLGRIEFDHDDDDDVERDDFVAFHACFETGGPFTPDDVCAISDIDQDGDVDLDDYDGFLLAYTGPEEDCNDNGILDLTDIVEGTSLDSNGNGIPDECEACIADLDGDGNVGFGDLLELLSFWGPCPDCPQDLDGSGEVGFGDLLFLLSAWGLCRG